MRADLHMHSNASDGTDSPEKLLANLQSKGIEIFALTDHDTIDGVLHIGDIVPNGMKFIRGAEFSCKTESIKCHILGLNYEPNNSDLQEALKTVKAVRQNKFATRIEFLHDKFGIDFTSQELEYLASIPSTGKPHLANMLVKKGYAKTRPEAITEYIDKCKTISDRIDASLAISSILSAGGIPVWAHPLGGWREPELTHEEFMTSLEELMSLGLRGLECWYSKYEYGKCRELADMAGEKGLYVSGGSDYHGTNKDIPLGRLNAEDRDIDAKKLTILEIF